MNGDNTKILLIVVALAIGALIWWDYNESCDDGKCQDKPTSCDGCDSELPWNQ